VAQPVYSPALVAFFGGPHVGVSVSIGTPFVSWVPLGWGEPVVPWWGPHGFVGRPYWGGWGGPRVVNNVVINNTTIVNVDNINRYDNVRYRNVVIGVDGDRFGRGRVTPVRLIPIASAICARARRARRPAGSREPGARSRPWSRRAPARSQESPRRRDARAQDPASAAQALVGASGRSAPSHASSRRGPTGVGASSGRADATCRRRSNVAPPSSAAAERPSVRPPTFVGASILVARSGTSCARRRARRTDAVSRSRRPRIRVLRDATSRRDIGTNVERRRGS
jgi:hypothetical protein